MLSTKDIVRLIERSLRPITGRVQGIIRRATVGSMGSGVQGQTFQAHSLADDVDDEVELFEQYGFKSVPPPGSEGVLLRVGGERSSSIGICFGDRSTTAQGLAPGEVVMYHPSGSSIIMRASGAIECTPAPGQTVQLGGPTAALAVARATDPVDTPALTALASAMSAFVPPAPDGGAALSAAISVALGLNPSSGSIVAGGVGSQST